MKYILLVLLAFSIELSAQDLPPELARKMEDPGEGREQEMFDDDAHWQQLDFFRRNPLDLNHASAEDLLALEIIGSVQAEQFIRYRQLLGKLIHIYELQAVPSWDIETIQKILPYIKITDAEAPLQSLLSRFRKGDIQVLGRWSGTLETLKGFKGSPPAFQGDPHHFFLRYTYQLGNKLQYGFLGEKDAGEQFFRGAQSGGFDFYSFHLFARKIGKIKELAFGDFTVNLGQGLIHWQSMAFGKGTNILNSKREGAVLRPYRSAGEFNFLRGVGITYDLGKTDLTVFASSRHISANTNDSSDAFSGFITSGLHRTASETIDRNSVQMWTTGGRLAFKTRSLHLGAHAVYYRFSKEIRKRDLPYNRFNDGGRQLLFVGADYSFTYKNLHGYGEVATDQGLDPALTGTVMMSLDPKLDLVLNFRKISHEYLAPFGNAFTENSLPGNESGSFAGVLLKPQKGIQVSAYADIFSFPWLKYRVDAPSKGIEHMTFLEIQPSRGSLMYILYRSKTKSIGQGSSEQFSFPFSQSRRTLRLHMQRQATPSLYLRARLEFSQVDEVAGKEEGFMVFLEPGIKKSRWEGSIRFQFFDTQGYDSRIYALERDVLFASALSMVYGRGWRWNANFRGEIYRDFSISIKIGRSVRTDGAFLGSGLSDTGGPSKTDLKIQIFKKC
jgi:hypothetical protein